MLYWAVLDSTGLYWDVLECNGLYWVVLGCTGHSAPSYTHFTPFPTHFTPIKPVSPILGQNVHQNTRVGALCLPSKILGQFGAKCPWGVLSWGISCFGAECLLAFDYCNVHPTIPLECCWTLLRDRKWASSAGCSKRTSSTPLSMAAPILQQSSSSSASSSSPSSLSHLLSHLFTSFVLLFVFLCLRCVSKTRLSSERVQLCRAKLQVYGRSAKRWFLSRTRKVAAFVVRPTNKTCQISFSSADEKDIRQILCWKWVSGQRHQHGVLEELSTVQHLFPFLALQAL